MKKTSKLLAIASITGLIIMIVSSIIYLYGNNQIFDYIARIGAVIFTTPLVVLQILFFTDKLHIHNGFWVKGLLTLAAMLIDFIFVLALNSVFNFLPNWRLETDPYLREYARESFDFNRHVISMCVFMMISFGSMFVNGLIIEPTIKLFKK